MWGGYVPTSVLRIASKDLLCNTGNSVQWYVAAWMGAGCGEKGYMYV